MTATTTSTGTSADGTQHTAQNLFRDLRTTVNAIEDGDWLDAGLGAMTVSMDIVGLTGDPLGAISASGVSWVLGAVSFLREPFDMLLGDPGAITSSARSWGDCAGGLGDVAGQYRRATVAETRSWTGSAADGYRATGSSQAAGLAALAEASRGVSQAMTAAGQALAAARKTVLDLINDAVRKIIEICVDALSKSWLSFGASVALGIARSVRQATQTAQRLLQVVQWLVSSLQKITQVVRQVMKVARSVGELLEMIGGRAAEARPTRLSAAQVTSNGAMTDVPHTNDRGVPRSSARPTAPGHTWREPPVAGQNLHLAQARTRTGPVSQNGWPVNPPRGVRTIPGTDVRVNVADGPAGDVLMYVLGQVHARVESVELNSPAGEADDWGYAHREVRGGQELSNHASATAVDINATRHVLGARGTFTQAQVDEIHAILAEVDHVVRWGGDYRGRADEMHFEINASVEEVTRVAERLRTADGER